MKYDVLESIINVALNAGNYIGHYYEGRGFKVSEKKDSHDLVTDVDRESQRIITTELSRRFPDISIIGEEDRTSLETSMLFC